MAQRCRGRWRASPCGTASWTWTSSTVALARMWAGAYQRLGAVVQTPGGTGAAATVDSTGAPGDDGGAIAARWVGHSPTITTAAPTRANGLTVSPSRSSVRLTPKTGIRTE